MATKSMLVERIGELIAAVGDRLEGAETDAERDYMSTHCPPRLEPALRTLPTLSLHLLAALDGRPLSVVGLAAHAGQLKGTVSKHVQRLVDAGLVRRVPVPGNRKEVTLVPTADGRTVIDVHRAMHVEQQAGLGEFLRRYRADELAVLVKVLDDLAGAERVGFGYRVAGGVTASGRPAGPRGTHR